MIMPERFGIDGLGEPTSTKMLSPKRKLVLTILKKLKLESKASFGGRNDNGLNNEGDGAWRKGWVRER